jgi:RsiW-degrading membrane proteinase PrsW (M82 family)
MTRRKIAKRLVLLYLLGAVGVLARFLLSPPDDAADLAMVVWTLPTALIGLFAVFWPLGVAYPFMPAALGYYVGHLAFFLPSVALISYLVWRIVGGKGS